MAGQLKLRRGTTSQLANFIGSEGELTYDTVLKSLVLHDGVTVGGVKIPYLSNDLVPSTMLPTATESVVGASKIATTAIAQAGVNDSDFITPAKLKGYLDTKVLGINQTWQNLTASRAAETIYTNTTGKPIQVAINYNGNNAYFDVGGVEIFMPDYNSFGFAFFIIPNGTTYRIRNQISINSWSELR